MKQGVLALFFASLLSPSTAHSAEKHHSEIVRSRIPRAAVISTGIAAIGYSKRLQVLEMEFANGAVYRYKNVPASVYRNLVVSDSKGQFYHQRIRGKYRFLHVKSRRTNGS
jgi:KTSC domain